MQSWSLLHSLALNSLCSLVEFDPSWSMRRSPVVLTWLPITKTNIHSLCWHCKWIQGFSVFSRQKSLNFNRKVSPRMHLCYLQEERHPLLHCQHMAQLIKANQTHSPNPVLCQHCRSLWKKWALHIYVVILWSLVPNVAGCVSLCGFTAHNQFCPIHIDHGQVVQRKPCSVQTHCLSLRKQCQTFFRKDIHFTSLVTFKGWSNPSGLLFLDHCSTRSHIIASQVLWCMSKRSWNTTAIRINDPNPHPLLPNLLKPGTLQTCQSLTWQVWSAHTGTDFDQCC